MSAEVFISYAAKDRERVSKLVEGLQQAGVSVWIDMAGIEVAAMWSKEIVSAIRECKVLLLSISPQSTESENVVKELALASERKKPIIPIYLEPAEIPETMEYQLAGIQRVEFYEGREEIALQAVIRALAKLGVTVADEASAAAAGVPNITAHGVSHSGAGQAKASEGAAWGKIAAAVGGVAVLAAGLFFLGGSIGETTTPLGQAGTNATNATEQAKPLAKSVTLDTNRVVVLPFKTIGTSGETADLGYGLVSTLTSKLQPLQNLVVIAKESARKYEDTKLSPKEIGQALGAGTIVTGEIQTSSDKVQVNIQLVNANTEALGWGSTFTKTKDEFLDLQNEIATQLASELKGGLDAAKAQQLAQKATDKKVRNPMRRFLAETDHRVLVFQNGFQWDRKRYLKRFGEIDSVLGKESSWVSFDERTFKANPFNFIREYILCSVMFGGTDPNEAGFTKNLFREFLGEGDDLEISIPEPERYNRNADAFFVCEIGESDFFAGCFRNNQKKESSLQYAAIGKSLETVCVVRNPSRIYAPVIKKYPKIEKSNVIGMAGEPLEINNPNFAHLRAFAEMKLREVKCAA